MAGTGSGSSVASPASRQLQVLISGTEIGQGEAHHRPAHQHALQASLGEAGERQQLVYWRTDQRLDVHRPLQGAAGEGGDPRDQRPTEDDGIVHGGQGADVLAQDADVRRQAVRRDSLPVSNWISWRSPPEG